MLRAPTCSLVTTASKRSSPPSMLVVSMMRSRVRLRSRPSSSESGPVAPTRLDWSSYRRAKRFSALTSVAPGSKPECAITAEFRQSDSAFRWRIASARWSRSSSCTLSPRAMNELTTSKRRSKRIEMMPVRCTRTPNLSSTSRSQVALSNEAKSNELFGLSGLLPHQAGNGLRNTKPTDSTFSGKRSSTGRRNSCKSYSLNAARFASKTQTEPTPAALAPITTRSWRPPSDVIKQRRCGWGDLSRYRGDRTKRTGSTSTRAAWSMSASRAASVAAASLRGNASANFSPSSARSSTSGRHSR